MCKAIIFAAVGLMASAIAVQARPQGKMYQVATGTNIIGSVTCSDVSGYIDSVLAILPTGTSTGTVTLTATPPYGTNTPVVIADKAIGVDTTFRPRFNGTGTDGVGLVTNVMERYMAIGDVLTYSIRAVSATGLTWRVYIKWDDGR